MICSTSICSECGTSFESEVYQSINVQDEPELKQRVISGEIFMRRCPSCGKVQLAKYPLLYVDPSEHLLLCLTDQELSVDGLEGYTARRVTTVGELIFTYPKNGDMEMLSVGFNVYQDCGGILARNPQLSEAAKGLATVNRDWLQTFIA